MTDGPIIPPQLPVPPPRPSRWERDDRRRAMGDMRLRGLSVRKIAAEFNLSERAVTRELDALERQWRESGLRDFDRAKGTELARLDHLERTYWRAWDESKRERTERRTEQLGSAKDKLDGGVRMAMRTETPATGDPRFLEGVRWCIAKRCELLGLNAPLEVDVRAKIIRLPTPEQFGTMDEWAAAFAHVARPIAVAHRTANPDGTNTPPALTNGHAVNGNGNGTPYTNGNGHDPGDD